MISILIKNISLLFLIIFAAIFSNSFAGRVQSRKSVVPNAVSTSYKVGGSWEALRRHDEESEIHDRFLQVKTNDYGRYDPPPALVKPPFKLIPN